MTGILPAVGEVHLVWARLDEPLWGTLSIAEWLSPDERERAARLKVPEATRRFRIGRALLRVVLSTYLGLPPDSLRFRYNRHGKPSLEGQTGHDGLRFNLSHSGDLLLVALGRGREIGVDVERVRAVVEAERIAGWLFPERERQRFEAAVAHRHAEEFFRCWTRIEATAKAYGMGIGETGSLPPTAVTLYELSAMPGYVATLAVQGCGDILHIVEHSIAFPQSW